MEAGCLKIHPFMEAVRMVAEGIRQPRGGYRER
jgi:hypothetical protein